MFTLVYKNMISVQKLFNLTKTICSLTTRLSGLTISNKESAIKSIFHQQLAHIRRQIHITSYRNDLMEFFDDKKNWGENEVKVGRSWKLDELRLKSNTDLHKLWYILLKEKNMLLTTENECNANVELFPSPERLDKVRESMAHLEQVVKERNKAYHLLETGVTGERPANYVSNQLGMRVFYRSHEHIIPRFMNKRWKESHKHYYNGYAVRKFLRLYRESLYNVKRKAKNRDRNHVMRILRRNPALDVGMLKEKYPHVDIDKLIKNDEIRGHYIPKI